MLAEPIRLEVVIAGYKVIRREGNVEGYYNYRCQKGWSSCVGR